MPERGASVKCVAFQERFHWRHLAGGIGSLSETFIRETERQTEGKGEEKGREGRHTKKAIETSIVKFVARFRCSPFPTGVTPYISSLDINITSQ